MNVANYLSDNNTACLSHPGWLQRLVLDEAVSLATFAGHQAELRADKPIVQRRSADACPEYDGEEVMEQFGVSAVMPTFNRFKAVSFNARCVMVRDHHFVCVEIELKRALVTDESGATFCG